jgi:GT2 family glycosyltransferase
MRVSALITNYETWPLTQQGVRALMDLSSGKLSEIVVVDDASVATAPPELLSLVRVIENEKNVGYVTSVNRGFAAVSGDVVLLLDSDAYPLEDLVPTIQRAFTEEPRLGALGFNLVDREGRATGAHQGTPSAAGLVLGQQFESIYASRFRRTTNDAPIVYSCAIAVRRSAFQAVGGFDESFDFLDADVDFGMRLKQHGFQVRVDSKLNVVHEGGGSPQLTSKRVLRHHRMRWKLLQKHGLLPAPAALKCLLAARHAVELLVLGTVGARYFPRDVLEDKRKGRKQLLSEVWSGYGNS